jgi:pilus assembly protein Flp/PilA
MIAQFVFARLYTQLPGRARKQRGASALEYIALAAALIIIIGVLATNGTVSTALETAFTNLFTDASDTTP